VPIDVLANYVEATAVPIGGTTAPAAGTVGTSADGDAKGERRP